MNAKTTFTPARPVNTAVLFLVFNRPDTTQQVFESIRQAQPPRLYVAADGARAHKEGEAEKVQIVRDYILSKIDWECEVKTLFREENLACKYAVSSAITWFFENEEQGIILEDDCLPNQSFFTFCEELLDKYKNDLRVWQISGNNFQDDVIRGDGSYYFSRYNHIWGWATWKDRWKNYNTELENIDNNQFINNIFPINNPSNKYWKNIFNRMKNNEIDTWDYQWTFTVWTNNGLTILPQKNLISNIGFGTDATHTTSPESKLAQMSTYEIKIANHPSVILANLDADIYTANNIFISSIQKKVKSKIKKLVKNYFNLKRTFKVVRT